MYKSSRVCSGCKSLIQNTSSHSQKRADDTAKRFEKEGRVCKSCGATASNNKRWSDPEAVHKQSQRFLQNNPSKGKPAWNRGVPRDEVTREKIKQTKQLNGGTAGDRNPNYGKFKYHNTQQTYKQFRNRVVVLTERVKEQIEGYVEDKRGRAGIPGAYQIDHIRPIIDCWYEGWTPEQVSDLTNLRFISWEENLKIRKYKGNIMKKSIEVRIDIEGLHCWDDCNLPNVQYLQYPHRHTFQVACMLEVGHSNRETEFIDFKHKIRSYIQEKWYDATYNCCNFGSMSCEHIAENLLVQFNLDKCSVSEDGEFFGIVEK